MTTKSRTVPVDDLEYMLANLWVDYKYYRQKPGVTSLDCLLLTVRDLSDYYESEVYDGPEI